MYVYALYINYLPQITLRHYINNIFLGSPKYGKRQHICEGIRESTEVSEL